jgi:cellulose synthase/poly-beta-1,6-N-acetylglucosamine synthase-like glycosyltransferase
MPYLEIAFWACASCALYTYFLYPLFIALLACLCGRRTRPSGRRPRSVSFVLAAHNEAALVARRLEELTALIAAAGVEGEIIVVSDGSTDATAEEARRHGDRTVQVLGLAERHGKAVALTRGCALARNDVLVFADLRQRWAADALRALLDNFADPTVGAVSGDLVIECNEGVLAGVGLYWRFEKWLRRGESRVASMVGVTGAISAVRRKLFRPVPPGTILDDVYWPLCVAMQGYRVVHDVRAKAFDRLPSRARDEFKRKVRTLAGNFQLATLLPAAMLPWRNPIWLQFLSHKILRVVVPWLLVPLFVLSAVLPGPLYELLFWAQALFYVVGLIGLVPGTAAHFRPAAAAGSFLVLNAASWFAFWVWVSGRAEQSWKKVAYEVPQPAYACETLPVASRLSDRPSGLVPRL